MNDLIKQYKQEHHGVCLTLQELSTYDVLKLTHH
jgi:hypothetical protein